MFKSTKHAPFLLLAATLLAAIVAWALLRPVKPLIAPHGLGVHLAGRVGDSLQRGDWDSLASAATEWMRASGDHSEAARLLAYAALAQGRVAEAENHFIRADCLRVGPPTRSSLLLTNAAAKDSPVVLVWRADLAARNDQALDAWTCASDALALDPALSIARLLRASLAVRANCLDLALGDLAQVRQDDPVWKEARLSQALIHLSQGHNELAETELRPLVEAHPSQPLALNAMGVIKALAGKWAEAADSFAKAYSASPQFEEAKLNWRVAQTATDAPGSVLALRTEVMDANKSAMQSIQQGMSHSQAAARDTAAGDTLKDAVPYAKAAGGAGALAKKNPWVALGAELTGNLMNRAGDKTLQNAASHAASASQADRNWDREVGNIMRSGALANPGSPQARAYEARLTGVRYTPAPGNDRSMATPSQVAKPGGVTIEASTTSGTRDGTSTRDLILAYPIFLSN